MGESSHRVGGLSCTTIGTALLRVQPSRDCAEVRGDHFHRVWLAMRAQVVRAVSVAHFFFFFRIAAPASSVS